MMCQPPATSGAISSPSCWVKRFASRCSGLEFSAVISQRADSVGSKRVRPRFASPHHVADAYRQAHEACRMEGDRLPKASAVQEMVAVWKVLWGWRRKGALGRSE